jgi:hypothetical protein
MSIKAISWALSCKTGSPAAKLVLIKLADNANDAGRCWPSVMHIVKHTELSERGVRAHIKALADAGFVRIESRYVEGVQIPNVYVLNLPQDVGVVQEVQGGGAPDAGGGGAGGAPQVNRKERNRHLTKEVVADAPRRSKGTHWPSEAVVSEEWKQEGLEARERNHLSVIDINLCAEQFANYWTSRADKGAAKTNWKRAWIYWVTNQKGQANGSGKGLSAHTNFALGAILAAEEYDKKHGN